MQSNYLFNYNHWQQIALGSLLGFLLILSSGCSSTKDLWNARIDNYSYDEAVIEMGPPDREATLQDGTRICEWRTAKGSSYGYSYGSSAWPYNSGPWIFQNQVVRESLDFFIRLTFSKEGQLKNWEKVRR